MFKRLLNSLSNIYEFLIGILILVGIFTLLGAIIGYIMFIARAINID